MFKSHHIYSHINMLDCSIYILKSYRLQDGRYKLKVGWYKKDGFNLNIQETVVVTKNQLKNWYEM